MGKTKQFAQPLDEQGMIVFNRNAEDTVTYR